MILLLLEVIAVCFEPQFCSAFEHGHVMSGGVHGYMVFYSTHPGMGLRSIGKMFKILTGLLLFYA